MFARDLEMLHYVFAYFRYPDWVVRVARQSCDLRSFVTDDGGHSAGTGKGSLTCVSTGDDVERIKSFHQLRDLRMPPFFDKDIEAALLPSIVRVGLVRAHPTSTKFLHELEMFVQGLV